MNYILIILLSLTFSSSLLHAGQQTILRWFPTAASLLYLPLLGKQPTQVATLAEGFTDTPYQIMPIDGQKETSINKAYVKQLLSPFYQACQSCKPAALVTLSHLALKLLDPTHYQDLSLSALAFMTIDFCSALAQTYITYEQFKNERNLLLKDINKYCIYLDKDAFEYIKQQGVLNEHYSDEQGNNALHYAVYNNRPKAIAWLIQAGLKINKQNNMGMTPLHTAVINNNGKIVKKLLMGKALSNIPNSHGKTAYDLASADIKAILDTYNEHRALQRSYPEYA